MSVERFEEFEFLKDTNYNLVDATEALFEKGGVAERGIVLITDSKSPKNDIALTLTELKRIVERIENKGLRP